MKATELTHIQNYIARPIIKRDSAVEMIARQYAINIHANESMYKVYLYTVENTLKALKGLGYEEVV